MAPSPPSIATLSDADFKHANLKASETIDISSFTEAAEISPAYYQIPYYLLPGKGEEKVYALLTAALQSSRKVAVATFVMRGRQHLCVVTPAAESLMLITLSFAKKFCPRSSWRGQFQIDKAQGSRSACELNQKLRGNENAPE
ncbi:MAG: Ku protein [Steroidobacteraceae bacterium]